MSIDQLSLEDAVAEGERLKAEGMARAVSAEPKEWRQRADEAVRRLALRGQPFTAEAVREFVGDPEHPNAFGAVFSSAARAGLIFRVGYELSKRPSLHRHPIAVWMGI